MHPVSSLSGTPWQIFKNIRVCVKLLILHKLLFCNCDQRTANWCVLQFSSFYQAIAKFFCLRNLDCKACFVEGIVTRGGFSQVNVLTKWVLQELRVSSCLCFGMLGHLDFPTALENDQRCIIVCTVAYASANLCCQRDVELFYTLL